MKTKLTLKKIILTALIAILTLIILAFTILAITSKKPVAAFYNIPEYTQNGIKEVLQSTYKKKNSNRLPFKIVVLDTSKSLEECLKQQKKIDLLFINRGLNYDYAVSLAQKKNTGFNIDLQEMRISTSLKKILPLYEDKNEIKTSAFPLLIENYQIDVHMPKFRSSGVKEINVLSDIQTSAKNSKAKLPIIFNGSDDTELINIFGALVEAVGGYSAWSQLVNSTKEFAQNPDLSKLDYNDFVQSLIKENGILYKTAQTIFQWKADGILPKNIINFTERDLTAFANSLSTGFLFITLTEHRQFERNIIKEYTTIFYPSADYYSKRYFTSPVIMGLSLSKNKIARKSLELLQSSLQESLSSKTGIAPTDSYCMTPDKQASDARYWVAASEPPLPALSDACFKTKAQKAYFADALRALFK